MPSDVVKCISAFLEFCYIARRNTITSDALEQLKSALKRFHDYRKFFVGTAAIKGNFVSLPRQHSLVHYFRSIELFGSPNGICSSITESKHIKAVKEPWRRSNRYQAIIQMLRTLCRLDKLAAVHGVFTQLGMMDGTTASYTAMILAGGKPQPRAILVVGTDDVDENGPAAGPKVLSSVKLCQRPGTPLSTLFDLNLSRYL